MCFVRIGKIGLQKYRWHQDYYQRFSFSLREIPISQSKTSIQINSVVALAKALYSVLVLEHETKACFLALHATKLGANKIRNLHVECRIKSTQSSS
jgi:hypothetical protein